MKRVQFIWNHLTGYKLLLFSIVVAVIIYAAFNLFAALTFGFVIDNVINQQPVNNVFLKAIESFLGGMEHIHANIWIIGIFILGVYAIYCLLMSYRQIMQGYVSENLVEAIRKDLYQHIQRLPYKFHVGVDTGELIQKCTSDVDMVRRFFSGQFAEIFYTIATAGIALVVLFSIHSTMAAITCVSLVIVLIYSYRFFNKVQKQFLKSDQAEAVMSTKIQESLSGVRVVKAFNREQYEVETFDKTSRSYTEITQKMIEFLGSYWASSYVVVLTGILLVVIAGIFNVHNNTLTVGNFFVFIEYNILVLYPIRQLGRILSDFGKLMVSIDRLQGILDEPQEDLVSGISEGFDGDIVFDHVSFHYDNSEINVLNDVNFTIKKGSTVAILGPTGSGKSTLMYLMNRLYDPTAGSITFNGIDSKSINRQKLREYVGVVLQEPFLFSKTIEQNLKTVSTHATHEQMIESTKVASVHDVIESFKEGYQTIVGEKGVTLSGGQKQRVAIARTVLKDTPVLVFDDSLSAVDTQTDEKIRHALLSMKDKKTMVIITQRIASAKNCDLIVVLENGKISQMGTHDQLVNQPGLYQRVFNIQSTMEISQGGEK